ncbi:hypothetical protein K0B90_05050 [bacterium]|nr:hypothetical protein [bacterium]
MRKGFLTVLAVVLVAAMAAPAMAEFSTSGFVRIKGHVEQNYTGSVGAFGSGGLFILPSEDPSTAAYVEQRQRFSLNWKGENVGAAAVFEIDFGAWGDSAYTAARNQGAGLEADSINLETKDFYLWFNIPNTGVKVTAGLQNQTDSFGGMIFGYADMAGIFLTGNLAPVSYKLGWAKFQEGGTRIDDDVDLYVAEVKFSPVKEAKLGLDFYAIRDASGHTTPLAGGQTNLNTIGRIFADYGAPLPAFTYDTSMFYYLGVDGAFKAGPVGLSGYAFYNFGSVENIAGSGVDLDVKAFGVDLRADLDAGPGKLFIEAAYVSGSDLGSDDWESPIVGNNYALAGSFPLSSMDMQILFPNLDDINASAALAYDVANKGRGIMAIAAGFRMKFSDTLAGKIGAGYLADVEAPDSSVDEHSAIEVNANLNYTVAKGMDVGLYGAYAFLQDWESYSAAGVAIPGTDADDIFKVYLRMNYAF